MTNDEEQGFIAYYILSGLSIACNLLILCLLFFQKKGLHTPFIILISILHFSNTCEEILLIPFIYKGSTGLCQAVESFKYYFGLMNVFSIFFLIQAYRLTIFNNVQSFSPSIKSIVYFMVFIFPLVSFLPYSDGSYQMPSTPWCSMPVDKSNFGWAFAIQYFWVWLVLILCAITNLRILNRVLIKNGDVILFRKYALNAGAYSFVSVLSWTTRSLEILDPSQQDSTQIKFIEYFPLLIAGIFYAILFFINMETLKKFNQKAANNSLVEPVLTWNTSDILEIMDQLVDESKKSMKFIFRPSISSSSALKLPKQQRSHPDPLQHSHLGLSYGNTQQSLKEELVQSQNQDIESLSTSSVGNIINPLTEAVKRGPMIEMRNSVASISSTDDQS